MFKKAVSRPLLKPCPWVWRGAMLPCCLHCSSPNIAPDGMFRLWPLRWSCFQAPLWPWCWKWATFAILPVVFTVCLCISIVFMLCLWICLYRVGQLGVFFLFMLCLLVLHSVYAVFMIAGGAALIQYCSVFQRAPLTLDFLNASLEMYR